MVSAPGYLKPLPPSNMSLKGPCAPVQWKTLCLVGNGTKQTVIEVWPIHGGSSQSAIPAPPSILVMWDMRKKSAVFLTLLLNFWRKTLITVLTMQSHSYCQIHSAVWVKEHFVYCIHWGVWGEERWASLSLRHSIRHKDILLQQCFHTVVVNLLLV